MEVSMSTYAQLRKTLSGNRHRWLVTGGAGFIGSHLVEHLLNLGQEVVNLDNFATGHRTNLDEVKAAVGPKTWARHHLIEADIRDPDACADACKDVEYVLHHAALGSVPRSIQEPALTHAVNVTGTLNMLMAAAHAGVRRFVYASSSSVYGDDMSLPKRESVIGDALSPYAVSKRMNELYAEVFARCYGLETVGLRYFNVFGARQDPNGPYAAVIPCWVRAMLTGNQAVIYGDGETSRDFCYVANVVQANLLAATTDREEALNKVYNVALSGRTTLRDLHDVLKKLVQPIGRYSISEPRLEEFRAGDIRHSQADISAAKRMLGFEPRYQLEQGLDEALAWYVRLYADREAVQAQ
jgi:UDP-N-acetylglucosamine 4-epimerase